MSILLEVGRRIGIRRSAEDPEERQPGSTFSVSRLSSRLQYTLLDIEYRRLGFFRVDNFDQALVELGESMK